MNFQLTEEQLAVQEAARDFAQSELLPGVIERDTEARFPKEQIQKTPKIIWEKIRSQQKYSHEEIDHFIERTWRVLLCKPKYKLVIVAIFIKFKVCYTL